MDIDGSGPGSAVVTVAERDPFDPLPIDVRRAIGRRLLDRAGYAVARAPDAITAIDPGALAGQRR